MKIKRSFETVFETKEAEGESSKHTIIGRPVMYDTRCDLYWFFEEIRGGALDKTDLRDVLFFTNHDISKIPLARSRNNNASSTMRLAVDERGLAIEADIDTERNAEAMSLYSAIERGDMSGMSFMFQVSDEEWHDLETDKPTRVITGIETIYEVSAVNFPAYEQTELGVRDTSELDSLRRALESARAKAKLESEPEAETKGKTLNLARAKALAL